MKRRIAIAIVATAALVVPAASVGLNDRGDATKQRAGLGTQVAKDSARDNPAAAVARVDLREFGKVSYRITARPSDVKVDWGITSRCVKGPLIDYWPPPGKYRTRTKEAGFTGSYPVPLADPDYCTFAVHANTDTVGLGKSVRVKIYKQG